MVDYPLKPGIWKEEDLLTFVKEKEKQRARIFLLYNSQNICICKPYTRDIEVLNSTHKEWVNNALDCSGLYELKVTLLPLGRKKVETRETGAEG